MPAQDAYDAILAKMEKLSPSERQVASYVLRNREKVADMDAQDLARAVGISPSTVTRFVHGLGFGSYALFRVELARQGQREEGAEGDPSSISMDDVPSSLAYIAANKVEEMRACARMLDAKALERAVRVVEDAELVVFVGIGTGLSYAQLCAYKFSQFGIRAIALSTTDATSTLALSLGERDCVIFVSNSGDSTRLSLVMAACKRQGTSTIVLTGNPRSSLAGQADVLLSYPLYDYLFADDYVFSINSMNFVMESMLLLLLHDSDDSEERLALFRDSIRFERRNVHFPFDEEAPHPEP